MNKKHIVIGIISAALIFTGCGANNSETLPNETKNVAISTTDNGDNTVSNVNEDIFETVGDIIEFGDGEVHILTGDIAEIYKVSNDQLKDFYLGQTVSVTKETEEEYSLMPYINKDFTIRHTNMGDPIERITGDVISFSDEEVVIMTSESEMTFQKNNDLMIIVGETYEFDVITLGDSQYAFAAYSESQKLLLNIKEIIRQDNGEMEILAVDDMGGEYIVRTYQAEKNFNYTDLAVGQDIAVYAPIVLTSYPAQVPATRIDLLSDKPTGTTSIDYDFIGEVVSLEGNEVHVLSGDMIQIFNVDESQLEKIHLGEIVKLYTKDNVLTIEPYIIEDFSVRHTSMGDLIEEITGQITNIKETSDGSILTIEYDDKQLEVIYYGDMAFEMNKTYEFGTFKGWDNKVSLFDYYNPDTIISMTITSIERASNGEMILSTKDNDGGEYVVGTSYPLKNFNISELKVDDVINVYADAVMESWPMQVDTRKIVKVTER